MPKDSIFWISPSVGSIGPHLSVGPADGAAVEAGLQAARTNAKIAASRIRVQKVRRGLNPKKEKGFFGFVFYGRFLSTSAKPIAIATIMAITPKTK